MALIVVQNDDLRVGDEIKEFRTVGRSWSTWISPGLVDRIHNGEPYLKGGSRITRKGAPYEYRVERADGGRTWIPGEQLRVGHVIWGYRDRWGKECISKDSYEAVEITDKQGNGTLHLRVRWNDKSRTECGMGHATGYHWLVEDCGPIASAPPPAAPSAWNGRCPRCGKGTYTGLLDTEHEGGGCP